MKFLYFFLWKSFEWNICFLSVLLRGILDEGDVVPLEEHSAWIYKINVKYKMNELRESWQGVTDALPGFGLDIDLLGIIEDNVHVLIETNNVALHVHVDILKQPDIHSGSGLKVSEDQVLWRNEKNF